MADFTIPQTGGTIHVSGSTTPTGHSFKVSYPTGMSGTTALTGDGDLTIAANTGSTTISGNMILSCTTDTHSDFDGQATSTKTYSVSQAGKSSESLSISPTSYSPGSAETTTAITVTSNTKWTASTTDTWITITAGSTGTGDGTTSLSISKNSTSSSRTGSVTFTGSGGTSVTLSVNQDAGGSSLKTYYWVCSGTSSSSSTLSGDFGITYSGSTSSAQSWSTSYNWPSSVSGQTSLMNPIYDSPIKITKFNACVTDTSYTKFVFEGTTYTSSTIISGVKHFSGTTSVEKSEGNTFGGYFSK